MKPEEENAILGAALREPDRSLREVACWLSDHAGSALSESSVYRVLKRHGLIREVQVLGFPAGKEHRIIIRSESVVFRTQFLALILFQAKFPTSLSGSLDNGGQLGWGLRCYGAVTR
jgi:hypothetical protein